MSFIIVDAHQDIAFNYLVYGREYRQSVGEKRAREANIARPIGTATVGLPDAQLGRIAVTFATLFTEPATSPAPMGGYAPRYKTPQEAYRQALAQMDYYQRMADETPRIRLIRTSKDLDAVLASWADDAPADGRLMGFVVLMENGDPILEPKQFEEWYERGVRVVGPAWAASRYCGGTAQPGGLTSDGRRLLDVLRGYNAILDLSHMAEQAYYEALDQFDGVVIASHSNPRRFRNTDRHLSDDMIRRLAERDGVMGIVPYNYFLSDTWRAGDRRSDIPLSLVIDAIDMVCQLTGSAAHVGIGSDYDGGFGVENLPKGIDTVTSLYEIGAALSERGYSDADVRAILSDNFLRKLRAALPA